MLKLPIRFLKLFTILYLSLSYFIFFIGWIKPPYAVLASIILLYLIIQFIKSANLSTSYFEISKKNLLLLLLITLIWVGLSGAGGFGYQIYDYYKTNALIKDFMEQKWPVSYIVDSKQVFLAHYLGYYLPVPAIVGFLGWKITNLGIFIFTYFGVLASLLWFFRFIGKFSISILLLIVFINGIELIGLIANNGFDLLAVMLKNVRGHIPMFFVNTFNVLPLSYVGMTDILYWSPQHALPCWLLMGMLLNDFKFNENSLKYSPFYCSLLIFWSPLVMVGFAPFLLFIFIKKGFLSFLNKENFILAPIIFVLMALYILALPGSNLYHHFIFDYIKPAGVSTLTQVGVYVFFLLMNVIVWWLPAYTSLKESRFNRHLLLLVLFLLCTIPLYRFGLWNDWCTRVSLPSLLVLFLMVSMALEKSKPKMRLVIFTLLLLGSFEPLSFILGSLNHYKNYKAWTPANYATVGDVPSICIGFPVEQFVAPADSFFFKYIAKEKHE